MKITEVLRGHVFANEDQKRSIWSAADFCLDANVLLDVYRYTPENRIAFLKLLSALKGRLFVPHRVAIEFARNRIEVIRKHLEPQQIIRGKLDEAVKEITAKHPKHPLKKAFVSLFESAKKLVDEKYAQEEQIQQDMIVKDTILKELLAAIGEEIGEPFSESIAQAEHNRREKDNIPPYCKSDEKKGEERGKGDLVIWLELLKQYEGKGKPIIFVTADMKRNWWLEMGGKHYPQPALVQEAYARIGGEILFYTAERFNEVAPSVLGVVVPKELAKETRDIRSQEKHRSSIGNLNKRRLAEKLQALNDQRDLLELELSKWEHAIQNAERMPVPSQAELNRLRQARDSAAARGDFQAASRYEDDIRDVTVRAQVALTEVERLHGERDRVENKRNAIIQSIVESRSQIDPSDHDSANG